MNYKIYPNGTNPNEVTIFDASTPPAKKKKGEEGNQRKRRGINDYDYVDSNDNAVDLGEGSEGGGGMDYPNEPNEGLMPNTSEFFYRRARLFPNVKGCG